MSDERVEYWILEHKKLYQKMRLPLDFETKVVNFYVEPNLHLKNEFENLYRDVLFLRK